MKNVAAKKTNTTTETCDTACANCARLLSTLVLALPETDPLRRQAQPKATEGETRDHCPASMRGLNAIEGFAGEATEAMGKLSLAFAELMQSGDVDDDTRDAMLDAIGLVAMDLRLILAEASRALAANGREVAS